MTTKIVKKRCYRIVIDKYEGYEVQVKKRFLFFTYWKQEFVNTHKSIDDAKNYVYDQIRNDEKEDKKVVWTMEGCK